MHTGYFGQFGGAWVPEVLVPVLERTTKAYEEAKRDRAFWKEFHAVAATHSCRPTPLYFAERFTAACKGADIWVKREDLNQTGAHKYNNVLGQGLLARRMGKKRLIAETGAGQHGVATAVIGAKLGLPVTVYMGAVDVARQRPNVFWMERLGAKVVPVTSGTGRLKDAVAEAMRDYAGSGDETHYVVGSALGPHPFPTMVRDFQSIIGTEVKKQAKAAWGGLPDAVVACVGGGSNAIGLFHPFIRDAGVRMVGVEAGGRGGRGDAHARRLSLGKAPRMGVFEGFFGHFLQTEEGNLAPTGSICAGLDHPGIGPEHSYLASTGRAEYVAATDGQALDAAQLFMRCEGIIPALESAHALAGARVLAKQMGKGKRIVVSLSGRGDKDLFLYAEAVDDAGFKDFLRMKAAQ